MIWRERKKERKKRLGSSNWENWIRIQAEVFKSPSCPPRLQHPNNKGPDERCELERSSETGRIFWLFVLLGLTDLLIAALLQASQH